VKRPRSPSSVSVRRAVSSWVVPAIGSSSSSTRGSVASAMAISSCRFSPWLSAPAGIAARSASPTVSRLAIARSVSAVSPATGRRKRKLWPAWAWAATATFSSVVKPGSTLVIWNDRARPRRERRWIGRPVISCPSRKIWPASGAVWPPI